MWSALGRLKAIVPIADGINRLRGRWLKSLF